MPYKIIPHTADVRLHVKAASQKALFRDAVRGLMGVMQPTVTPGAPQIVRTFSLTANDRTALLIDFLNEILTQAYTNKETYRFVHFTTIDEKKIAAELTALPVSEFGEDVKAVTYHEANVRQNAKGEWETTLVFDI